MTKKVEITVELEFSIEGEIEKFNPGTSDEPPSGGNATITRVVGPFGEIPLDRFMQILGPAEITRYEEMLFEQAVDQDTAQYEDEMERRGDAYRDRLEDDYDD